MKRVIVAIVAGLVAGSAQAESALGLALDLGRLIGSEEACGLSFDQAAIAAYIERKVPADDLEFTGTFNNSAGATRSRLKKFSATQLTAHCVQSKRVAIKLGFVKGS